MFTCVYVCIWINSLLKNKLCMSNRWAVTICLQRVNNNGLKKRIHRRDSSEIFTRYRFHVVLFFFFKLISFLGRDNCRQCICLEKSVIPYVAFYAKSNASIHFWWISIGNSLYCIGHRCIIFNLQNVRDKLEDSKLFAPTNMHSR